MATQVFKGEILAGQISAEYRADAGNAGADTLTISYVPEGAQPTTDIRVAAPGGVAKVEVSAPKSGMLEVWVGASTDHSRGQLTVKRGGEVRDDDAVQGSTRWSYSVVVGPA